MLNDGVFAFFGINSHYIDFQNKKYLGTSIGNVYFIQ